MFCRQDADMGPNNIQPFAPEFRKSTCASNSARPKLTAALRIRLQAMRQRTFLLTTPEREGIYSNPFTCILSSCPRTLFNKKFRGATCCTRQSHTGERSFECKQRGNAFFCNFCLKHSHRRTSVRLQATRQCVFLATYF